MISTTFLSLKYSPATPTRTCWSTNPGALVAVYAIRTTHTRGLAFPENQCGKCSPNRRNAFGGSRIAWNTEFATFSHNYTKGRACPGRLTKFGTFSGACIPVSYSLGAAPVVHLFRMPSTPGRVRCSLRIFLDHIAGTISSAAVH